MRLLRLRIVLAAMALSAFGGAGIAFAASHTVTPKPLTIFAYCRLTNAQIDSDVDQSSPTSNFGASSDLYVRSKSGNANRRVFVQYSLTNCAVPTTASVTAADVSLYMSAAPPTSRTYEIRPVSASWTETGITWNNQPAAGGVTSTNTTGTTSGVRRSWTVTADVQSFASGSSTNYGWRLSDQTEDAASSPESKFASSEWGTAADLPLLTIQYYP